MLDYLLLLVTFFVAIYFYSKYKKSRKVPSSKKCVLITGCDSGVGLFTAITAHKLGFFTIATCLDKKGYGAVLMREKYPDILVIQMDVTNIANVEEAMKTVEEYLSSTETVLWALINNAGVLIYGDFEWQLRTQALLQVNVNLVGVLQVTKTFQRFVRHAKGRIINITSANGHWCLPGLSVYCATKHALEGFSNSLRMEMIPWGVKVMLVNPGNLPGSTHIMTGQQKHAKNMKENFTPEVENLYGNYFDLFQKHLEANFPTSDVDQVKQPLEDSGLEKILESSLLHESPKHYYENIPIGFRIFILVTKLLPTYYADRLMLKIWGGSVGYKLV